MNCCISLSPNFQTNQITQPLWLMISNNKVRFNCWRYGGLHYSAEGCVSRKEELLVTSLRYSQCSVLDWPHKAKCKTTYSQNTFHRGQRANLALQLTAGLEFGATSSQGSCYDRMRAREGHFMAVKQRYMMFPLPKISACLRVVKSSMYTPHCYDLCNA